MPSKFQTWFAAFIIWLFHISAIVGITIGHKDWFLEKTPLNLTLSLFLFFWVFPMNNIKKILLFLLFFAIGMFAEWLGINYGILFGDYEYGKSLGPKLDGVPWLIGGYWGLLAFITAEMASSLKTSPWIKMGLGAGLMVLLDFFMEQNAPNFDFWLFDGHVPIKNYITWFTIGFLMQFLLWRFKASGNKAISFNLYMAQLLFFVYFFLVRV
ncbi:carotenoid biosynthesis protein [Muricauda sp. JGD-17]|uniref:Carotenoid biosynthesis protein n=1 Tax=Flagellimonas ochracea TaxID=2696472 RepID=A0A964WYK4_9FLAO|nr:carotenoid biosynthesis protein [Allomuricauda ochracea]NAY93311.1 carotenoid biosynthesis protein [Allomuricauda ochracea]